MADNSRCLLTFCEEFLESSSSDSDDEIQFLAKENVENKPRIEGYVEQVVTKYSEEQFKSTFRLKRSTCEQLIEGFSMSEHYVGIRSHSGSPMTTAENHILSFLWFAANKCCTRDVAERFGVGQTTAFNQIERVMNYLMDISSKIITFPKSFDEKEYFAEEFKKISGFPGVLGCIDGSYFEIRTPAHKIRSTYVNRHDKTSLTMQAICDFKRFIDCFTGPPGKMHDSRIFRLSFISNQLPQICGDNYHILGDNAYHLRKYLLTPYKDYGNLTLEQRVYNEKLSATRVLIENSFGILKTRFRQLQLMEFHTVDKMTKFFIACCTLHNMCIDNDDMLEFEQEGEPVEGNATENNDARLRQLGEQKRNFICATVNTAHLILS